MMKSLFAIGAACLAAVPSLLAAPSIAAQGVKNAASYANPQLPNGSIAQGSIFNIFGANMGPASIAYPAGLPLTTSLSGTSVSVTVAGTTVQCFMIYTLAGQVAAILPSNTPVGTGTITVTYNGSSSPAAPITVAKSSFGIFTINQQGSGQGVVIDGNNNVNSNVFAFQPGETVVVWGTGLGPIGSSDASAPPSGNLPGINVAVSVGGSPATVSYYGRSGYAGEDQINFTIPAGVTGCNVPVGISVTNGASVVVSNYVTMSIGATTACASTSSYPPGYQEALNSGSVRVGSILLEHFVSIVPGLNGTFISDAGGAVFTKNSVNADDNNSYDLNYGACAIVNSPIVASTHSSLDAGPVINVAGPPGPKTMTQLAGQTGSFQTTFGGGAPLPGQTVPPLYFTPGTYTLNNGSGGKDVGGFNLNVTVPSDFTWTNFFTTTVVPRSQPLIANWTGGDPDNDIYLTGSSGATQTALVSFICHAKGSAGSVTVPVSILQALPASGTIINIPLGSLQMVVESPGLIRPNPSGLDLFTVGYTVEYSKSIAYQ